VQPGGLSASPLRSVLTQRWWRLLSDAVVSFICMVYMVVSHPRLLGWLVALAALYFGVCKLWANRHMLAQRAGLPLPRLQLPLQPQHTSLLFSIGTHRCVLFVFLCACVVYGQSAPYVVSLCVHAFAVGTVLVFYTIGHDVFVFIGITSSLVMSHAVFRVPLSQDAKKSDRMMPGSMDREGSPEGDVVADGPVPQAV